MFYLSKKFLALSSAEQLAVTWVRSNYRNWRQRFTQSREAYNAERPEHVRPENWAAWYDAPFGNTEFNRYIATVRRLLAGNLI